MSRIGKKIIAVPDKVEIKQENGKVIVKGPLGELSCSLMPGISLKLEDKELEVLRNSDDRITRGYHGLNRMIVANMVKGVSEGFERALQIVGVGYRATQQGEDLQLALGYSKPVMVKSVPGVKLVADGTNRVLVKGIDINIVSQFAANLRKIRPPDNYKGKGMRYEGEYVEKKAGKSLASK